MAKHQMKTFDPSSWEARELTAPDGRTWVPSSLAEEKNLISAYGYRFTDAVPAAVDEEAAPAPEAAPAAQPEPAPAPRRGKAAVSSEGTTTTPTNEG